MTDDDRALDAQLCERGVQHACLDVDCDVTVILPLAVTVTGTIERERTVA